MIRVYQNEYKKMIWGAVAFYALAMILAGGMVGAFF
jgi:hypothetical protein